MNNRGRSSFGGKKIQTQTSRASSTTSTIDTPSETSTSPSIDMSRNGHPTVNGVAADMESTTLNGSMKKRMPSKRKQSSPMMPPFMVSAPGKVIVFGEHAVVHGKVRRLSLLVITKLILFVITGSYCSGDFSALISPRYRTLEIETNHFPPIPRY